MPRSSRALLLTYLPLGLGAAIVVVAAAAWFLVPVRYEAFALLKVAEKPPSVLGAKSRDSDEFAIFKRTQVQLIRSNAVLQGTLREAEISRLATIQEYNDDPVSWLKDQLVIDYPDDAEIMRIAVRGDHADDLKKIVNKIVQVYMKEVVERERDLRLEHENKLEKSHSAMSAELQNQMGSLRTLEVINKTMGSESAKLKRTMAIDELKQFAARRARIIDQLDENAMQIVTAEAIRDHPADVRTAEPVPAANNRPVSTLTLPVLLKQKEHLEAQLKVVDEAIEKQTAHVDSLENFSATVAKKQEDLRALQRISTDLKSELDRVRIERLAPERIVKVDDAVLASGRGDALRKYLVVSASALVGLGLIVFGVLMRPRAS